MLADAGLMEAAFGAAMISFFIAAVGAALALAGVIVAFRSRANWGVQMVLGLSGLCAGFAYWGVFWHLNGDGALDHAFRHLGVHAIVIGPSIVGGLVATVLALLRRGQVRSQ